ncbi:MAG: sterol desaturase family protein [Pseudomonadota bacterium]
MEFLSASWTPQEAKLFLEDYLSGILFVLGIVYFGYELLRYIWLKRMTWTLVGDSVTNFLTFLAFPYMSYLLGATFFVGLYYLSYENWAPIQIPINGWTIIACVVLADFVYYWEHRFMHMTGIGWLTHTVHHSSPEFNISVAYRFGPLDGFFPLFFHLPLALLGFHPLLIFAAEIVVQMFQAILHTESIPKLPRWVESVMNTPSHHRVHHGSNPKYCDKNYAGIFIIWDRMFGTFEEEDEPVRYGLTKPIDSVNPLVVFFHGFPRLYRELKTARSWREFVGYLVNPPGWKPNRKAMSDREPADA